MELEPVTFNLHDGAQSQSFTSSAGRLWYGFQPADVDPDQKPLMVLFNGGPGASSEVLFSFNTTARSLDEDHNGGADIGPSPASWTTFANVLYVDARITGFSYNLMDDPSNAAARAAEFGIHNFNVWLDAADFVRVVLRFLAGHPEIQSNEVVLVGESYGGVRATAMLDLLLRYPSHGDGTTTYEDDALVDEIQEHLDAVGLATGGRIGSPEVAQQFTGQILVQPLLLGDDQHDMAGQLHDAAGSVIFDIAQETGTTFTPCSAQGFACDPFTNALNFVEGTAGRDRFAYTYPYNWLFDRIDSLTPDLSTLDLATELFGADPIEVEHLYARERAGAYRTYSTFPAAFAPPPGSLLYQPQRHELLLPGSPLHAGGGVPAEGDYPTTFGTLASWDTYYLASNYIVLDTFYSSAAYSWGVDPYADELAIAFLRNVAFVDTFITNAAWDLVIWGPSIPPTMEVFSQYVAAATHDDVNPAAAERPGEIDVQYQDGAFGLGDGQTRTIRFPFYDSASHTVPLSQPEEIAADIEAWLSR